MKKYSCHIVWITKNFGGNPEVIQIFELDLNDFNQIDRGTWRVIAGSSEAKPVFTIGSEPDYFTDPERPPIHVHRNEIFDNFNDCIKNAIMRIFSD